MAATSTLNKWQANNLFTQYDFDPDSTDAVDIAWVDMRDFGGFRATFFRTVGTGDLDTMTIIGNTSSTGAGTDRIIVSKTLTGVQPNLLGDYTSLEVSAEQIAEVGAANSEALRYVSLQLEFATSTDEGVVTYIRYAPRFGRDALSADNIA